MQTFATEPGVPEFFPLDAQAALEPLRDAAVFLVDKQGRIATWNQGVGAILGWESHEWIGQPLQLAFTPEDVSAGIPLSELRRATATGRADDSRWMQQKGGGRFYAAGVLTLLKDGQGAVLGYLKALRDGTRQQQALSAVQNLLQERDAELRALAEGVRDYAIFTLDTAGRISSWHTGAQLMKGYTADEAIGAYFEFLFTPEDRASGLPAQELTLAARNGEYKCEGERLCKDGRRFQAAVVLTALRGPRGELLGYLKLTQDIILRHQIERQRETILAQVQAARSEAERASQAKDDFLASVSHELRTPLSAIVGWAHVLEHGAPDAPTVRHGLSAISRNARIQSQLIEDLLDVSRIETGQLRLDMQRVELGGVIATAIDACLPAAALKRIGLRTVFSHGSGVVRGDAARLQQVVANLVNNAIKFTPDGGEVSLTLSQRDGQVRLAVADNGEGIAAEFLPHLFDRFQQQDESRARRHGGLGLGLTIVRQLVLLHHGHVEACSAGHGQGATFTVTLPGWNEALHATREATSKAGPAQPEVDTRLPRLDGVRVLLVDDEADMREVTSKLLEQAGAEVQLASSAAEALQAVADAAPDAPPDVIVSDIGMPGVDGHEFMRRLRGLPLALGGGTPAVAFSAYSRPVDRERALAAGFQRHLGKPASAQSLLQVVAEVCMPGRPEIPGKL